MDPRPLRSSTPPLAIELEIEMPASAEREVVLGARAVSEWLDEDALRFLDALRRAGLMRGLVGDELLRIAAAAKSRGLDARVDVVELYYAGSPASDVGAARGLEDRVLLVLHRLPATAPGLVTRLAALLPELGGIVLERIGGADDGPLVLRSGEHLAAVLNDYEELLHTDEIDLREIEAQRARNEGPMVTVRGLVRATNVLLDRNGVPARLVELKLDEHREAYVSVTIDTAIDLVRGGWLGDDELEHVMELAGW